MESDEDSSLNSKYPGVSVSNISLSSLLVLPLECLELNAPTAKTQVDRAEILGSYTHAQGLFSFNTSTLEPELNAHFSFLHFASVHV